MRNTVSVHYPVQHAVQEVTEAEYDHVWALFNMPVPHKVMAIKFIRHQYGLGLKEAKDICEVIGARPRVSF